MLTEQDFHAEIREFAQRFIPHWRALGPFGLSVPIFTVRGVLSLRVIPHAVIVPFSIDKMGVVIRIDVDGADIAYRLFGGLLARELVRNALADASAMLVDSAHAEADARGRKEQRDAVYHHHAAAE